MQTPPESPVSPAANGTFDKKQAYSEIRLALRGLLEGSRLPFETALVSLIALLKEKLPVASWVGFYRAEGEHLFVGPYQGKLACVYLRPGQGVCGTSFMGRRAVVVEDVHAIENHVFCDPAARSEIVVPVWHEGKLIGVLDLDSHVPAAFDSEDARNLEELLKAIEPLPNRVIL